MRFGIHYTRRNTFYLKKGENERGRGSIREICGVIAQEDKVFLFSIVFAAPRHFLRDPGDVWYLLEKVGGRGVICEGVGVCVSVYVHVCSFVVVSDD